MIEQNTALSSTEADAVGDAETADDSDHASQSTDSLVGRELVVIKNEESGEGWFARLLIGLGLRSVSSLRDDLSEALSGEGQAGDAFSPEERAMLQNILRLRERRVEDVMVQRAEVHAVDLQDSLADVLREFEETGHSRLPVYNDTLDDPRGMVLIKDLLLHMTKKSSTKRKGTKTNVNSDGIRYDLTKVDLSAKLESLKVIRKVLFVPPSMLATDLMARMQATRTQMALVIDEYGGTDGLVSLEDIVEEVVGEIEDEHDEDEAYTQVTVVSDGIWKVDGRIELEKLRSEIGNNFDPGEIADEMDTLGGLVFSLAGHVPVRGEVVTGLPGYEFRVLDADPRRIKQVQVVQTNLRDKRRKAASSKASE